VYTAGPSKGTGSIADEGGTKADAAENLSNKEGLRALGTEKGILPAGQRFGKSPGIPKSILAIEKGGLQTA